MFINAKCMIIAFIALTTTCNAGGYHRPMEIQETQITEINAGPSGYRKPYDNMPQEMPPPPPPPSYNRPPVEENFNRPPPPPPPQEPAFNQPEQNFNQQPLPEQTFNQQPDQNFNQQPPMDMRRNSYMSSSMGFMNQGPMPYRSDGGYFRG